MALPPDAAGQKFGLIKAALPAPAPVQRHRHHAIQMLVARQRSRQQLDERACHGLHAPIFVKVNPLSLKSLIRAITIGRVEPAQSMAAQGAPALLIERKCVFEGSAATGAEKLGRKRLRSAQALGT